MENSEWLLLLYGYLNIGIDVHTQNESYMFNFQISPDTSEKITKQSIGQQTTCFWCNLNVETDVKRILLCALPTGNCSSFFIDNKSQSTIYNNNNNH